MITREEYLDALELIDKYHRQEDVGESKGRILIRDWLVGADISQRLRNCLYNATEERHSPYWQLKYMDELTKRKFFQIRNLGKKTWKEFCDVWDVEQQNSK